MLVRSPGTRASEVREKKKEPESNRDQAGRDQIIGDHFALFHLQNEMYIYIYIYMYIAIYIPDNPQASRLAAARVWGVAVTSASHQYIY